MNWLTVVSWVAGPTLQIILLTFIVRRELHKVFPRFSSYILFQVLKSGVLFLTFRYSQDNYFDAYWTGNAISILLAVAVMDEILHHLFKQYGGIQTLGTMIFRWSCGLLLLLAIVGAVTSPDATPDRVIDAVLYFERSLRLMQCGLFFLLMLLCRVLKDSWRQPVFGVALGFGVFASIELILVSVALWRGGSADETVSLLKSAAYNAVTILWIGYLAQESEGEKVPVLTMGPVSGMNLALATPSSGVRQDESFIVWVEQAVDRVLSRHTWPAQSGPGTQITGRKPGPEESN